MTKRRSSAKDAAARDVWRLVMGFGQAQWHRASQELHKIGLTPGHLKLLLLLEPGHPRPMGALAQDFSCDASTMTWLVDRLEERGLVERRGMVGDRRVKTVALTTAGIDMKERAHAQMFEPPEELLALDRRTLDALRDAFSSMESARGAHAAPSSA
ncbi:MAG TPA: MarR family transcriptional regulator [Actinomycetota bacterium]